MISVTGGLGPREAWTDPQGTFMMEFPPAEGLPGPREVVVRLEDESLGGPWTFTFNFLPWDPNTQ